MLAFYGAKGGVGTTTIAINTAIALHRELDRKVALVDGDLQFGDHRVFLDLGLDRKSIVDLVTAPPIDAGPPQARCWSSTTPASTCCSRRRRPRTADLVTPEHIAGRSCDRSGRSTTTSLVDIDKRLDDLNLGDPRRTPTRSSSS